MKLETSNNTKIVATMGPASWHKDVMKDMIIAGVNVFRVNFSHGDHETHRRTIRLVKELNEEFNCKTAVLADLQGTACECTSGWISDLRLACKPRH